MRIQLSDQAENLVGKGETAHYEQFLAPLAVGQRAYVMVCCPSCIRLAVRASVHACVSPCVNFFFKHLPL